MPVPIASTLGMLGDNLRKRGSALPLGRRAAVAWTRGLDIPRGGETVLYTGQMWQMAPAINAMTHQLARFEGSRLSGLFGFARTMNRLVNLTPLLARTSAAERKAYTDRLRNIARLLKAAGVAFGYLYEDDLYAGGLAHDEGLDAVFVDHARRIQAVLGKHGVKRVITVDPHTTNMLRSVIPKAVPGFAVEVKSYLEVLAERAPPVRQPLGRTATIHDSCVYARYEGVLKEPRTLLARGGVRLDEPELAGSLTFCCGGPAEMLFPTRSADVARRRVAQLKAANPEVITACPLCLANLSRVAEPDVHIRDISDYLVEAYAPAEA